MVCIFFLGPHLGLKCSTIFFQLRFCLGLNETMLIRRAAYCLIISRNPGDEIYELTIWVKKENK